MNKNIITVKNVLSTGLFFGGVVLSTPAVGADIECYTSTILPDYVSFKGNGIVRPYISFDCNAETKITLITQNDAGILNDFADSLLKGMKTLDADISEWVDENFWDLV